MNPSEYPSCIYKPNFSKAEFLDFFDEEYLADSEEFVAHKEFILTTNNETARSINRGIDRVVDRAKKEESQLTRKPILKIGHLEYYVFRGNIDGVDGWFASANGHPIYLGKTRKEFKESIRDLRQQNFRSFRDTEAYS